MISPNITDQLTNKKHIKIYLWSLSLIIILLLPKAVEAQTSAQVSILDKCRYLFGPAIDIKENLFEVKPNYILHVIFTSKGALSALIIQPKYYLEETHPEWAKPSVSVFLSEREYETLLTQLEEINPKGNLLTRGGSSVTTGSKTDYLDHYENAFLHRLEFANEKEIGVQTFGLYFFHELSGVIEWKRELKVFGPTFYQISLAGCHYFIQEKDFVKLKEGVSTKLMAAGTIEGF